MVDLSPKVKISSKTKKIVNNMIFFKFCTTQILRAEYSFSYWSVHFWFVKIFFLLVFCIF